MTEDERAKLGLSYLVPRDQQVQDYQMGTLPMTVTGGPLGLIDWDTGTASAQVKGAILFAALCAGVPTTVREPVRSRDHTERMLEALGVTIERDGTTVMLHPVHELPPLDVQVPGDPSSAAYFAAIAAMAEAGSLELPGVGVNPTRTGFLETLRRMGATVEYRDRAMVGGEETATVTVCPSALHGAIVGALEVPAMIDELPLLACVASRAEGETVITGAAELRVKESDRIAAVVANLRALGAEAEELPDGLRVAGSRAPLRGTVTTHGDHRLAMAFGVLGALPGNQVTIRRPTYGRLDVQVTIDDPLCVSVSYPGFWTDLARVTAVERLA